MSARGQDERALALASLTRTMLELYDEQERLERVLDEWNRDQQRALELGIEPPRPSLGRVMQAAVQVHRGDAFWDRESVEPVPLTVVENNN